MNGFEKHGIKHLSAAQINMFADCPAAYVSKYLFENKGKLGVAGQVGVLVEKVVADTLMGHDFLESLESAKKTFSKDNAFNTSEKDISRIEDIAPMASLALGELQGLGNPEFVHKITGQEQQRVEIVCNGGSWQIPVIGFLDFVYPEHGLVVDLKTTTRAPSAFSNAHRRQAAIYRHARGNMAVRFLYVTPKKAVWLEDEDYKTALAQVKAIAVRMEAFLSAGNRDYLRKITPINIESFYWYGNEKIREELFGV